MITLLSFYKATFKKVACCALVLLFAPVFARGGSLADLDIEVGRAIFEKVWVSSPSSTTASDGLGPFYNARSCAQCHDNNTVTIHFSEAESSGQNSYGKQLQTFSVPGLAAEGVVSASYSAFEVSLSESEVISLQSPSYHLSDMRYGNEGIRALSPRRASSLAGIGLLAAIPDDVIAALADEYDDDNDGVSGRVSMVWDSVEQAYAPARFGWKAEQISLEEQVSRAFSLDMGIGSRAYPDAHGDCTPEQMDCLAMPNGNSAIHDDLEVSGVMMERLLGYLMNIPPPMITKIETVEAVVGKGVFIDIGCGACHQPVIDESGLSLRAYSDLLMHDMGEGLANQGVDGIQIRTTRADREWRTPVLWGIGEQGRAGRNRYLHDGRADTLKEAILWHGGEAEGSVRRFRSMAKSKRDDLIAFLNAL